MQWLQIIREASRQRGHTLDLDLIEELGTHAQAAFDAACARGASVAEAEAEVRGLISVWVAQAPALRRVPRVPPAVEPPPAAASPVAGLGGDLRYALRLIARQRAFATLVVLSIALAVGVMTTLFSVVDGVLWRSLPWSDADRLVRLTEVHEGATRPLPLTMTNVSYLPWMEHPQTIEAAGAWTRGVVTIASDNDTERVGGASVTPSVFDMLKARPVAGSTFSRDDANEVVLSYGFWVERFGAAPSAIGQTLRLNGTSSVIVGVMARDFMFPDAETRLWRPMHVPAVISADGRARQISTFSAMARLRPGVTPAQAAAEATAGARSGPDGGMTTLAVFGTKAPATVTAEPALEALTHDVKAGLIALFIAVWLLFVTAVANIASLQLARATGRYRELAIRSAIGAGTARLVRQLLVENVVLAAVGGVAGLILAFGLHRALPGLLPADFPRLNDIVFRLPVAFFALALTGVTGIILGLLPAVHLRGLRITQALTENSGNVAGGARTRARTVIMVGQVAAVSALLAGAALLVRSFVAMATHDRGFDPHHVLTARLTLPDYAFPPPARLELLENLIARARTLPGAPTVALTTGLPLSGSENLSAFSMPSVRPPAGTDIAVHAVRSVVTADFFAALGMRVVRGRGLQASDDSPSAPRVVVVNRTFAREYLTTAAVGDRIRNFMAGDGVDYEIVGVLDDVLKRGLSDKPQPEVYSILRQSTGPSTVHNLVLRTSADPDALAAPLRALVRQMAPAGSLDAMRTMDDSIATSLARPRLYAVLLSVFAASALLIASVGLFGVLSYSVSQRSREIAVRAALGAGPARIARLVFAQGAAVTVAGLALGLAAALAGGRYLQSLLYGVTPADLVTYVAVVVLVTTITVIACLGPARRALSVDPLTILRL